MTADLSAAARGFLATLAPEPRRIFFPFLLPDRNELDKAQKRVVYVNDFRRSWYDELRRKCLDDLVLFARGFRDRWPAPEGGALVVCQWHEPNAKRDPDNVVSGGRKMLLDALGPGRAPSGRRRGWAGAGVMHCDGRHCVRGFFDVVTTAANGRTGVEVIVAPVSGQLVLPVPALVDLRGAA